MVADRYRVEGALGAGGMGVVVSARHVDLDLPVAIKFLRSHLLSNSSAIRRFTREARVLAKLKSAHTARVLDTGALVTGEPYIVMDLLEGVTLKRQLDDRKPLPVDRAVEILLQTCVAVSEAHALGIVHRDLKPSNLFCCRCEGAQLTVKVLDFGISKFIEERSAGATGDTSNGTALGSAQYMSPEQMRSPANVDQRSDIWALGVIAYQLVCGRAPFGGGSLPEVAVQVATHSPAPLRESRSDLDARFEQVVLRCLDKDPGARYGSVVALAEALAPWGPAGTNVLLGQLTRGEFQGDFRSEHPGLACTPCSRSGDVERSSSEPDTWTETGVVPVKPNARDRRRVAVIFGLVSAITGSLGTAMLLVDGARGQVNLHGVTQAAASATTSVQPAFEQPVASSCASFTAANLDSEANGPPVPTPYAFSLPSLRGEATSGRARITKRTGTENRTPPRETSDLPPQSVDRPTKKGCEPPFTIDQEGNRVFIAECVE